MAAIIVIGHAQAVTTKASVARVGLHNQHNCNALLLTKVEGRVEGKNSALVGSRDMISGTWEDIIDIEYWSVFPSFSLSYR